MNYDIKPYISVGNLIFDMTRDEVAAALDAEPKQVRLAPESEHDADVFEKLGIVAHYDGKGLSEAYEFSGPVKPEYEGTLPLGMSATAVEEWLTEQDDNAQIDPPDFTSEKLGIAFYVPMDKIESVLVFREGYFNAL